MLQTVKYHNTCIRHITQITQVLYQDMKSKLLPTVKKKLFFYKNGFFYESNNKNDVHQNKEIMVMKH